jgi:hypothetical protein
VTDAGIKELKKALPKCRIITRQPRGPRMPRMRGGKRGK